MRALCIECDRPIVARKPKSRRVYNPKGDHDLCQKCWKAQQDRFRVKEQAHAPRQSPS